MVYGGFANADESAAPFERAYSSGGLSQFEKKDVARLLMNAVYFETPP
jgi:hypothetical protein